MENSARPLSKLAELQRSNRTTLGLKHSKIVFEPRHAGRVAAI